MDLTLVVEFRVFPAAEYEGKVCIGPRPIPVQVDGKQFVASVDDNLNWHVQFEAARVIKAVILHGAAGR